MNLPKYRSERFALLYGIMLGDGFIGQYGIKQIPCVGVICHLFDDADFIHKIVKPLFEEFAKNKTTIRRRENCNSLEVRSYDPQLFQMLRSLNFPVGKKGDKIEIHRNYFKQNLIRKVIQGFIATDGCLVLTKNKKTLYPRIEAHAACGNLLRQIHSFLTSINIGGGYYRPKLKNYGGKVNSKLQRFRIQFNGFKNLVKFRNEIGFINPKHEKRFQLVNNLRK